MKTHLPLYSCFSITVSLFLFGCSDCKNVNLGSKVFTTSERAIIPYSGPDSIVFMDLDSNISVFASNDRINQVLHGVPDEDCLSSYYLVEEDRISFYSQDSSRIVFKIGLEDIATNRKYLDIYLENFTKKSESYVRNYFESDTIYNSFYPDSLIYYEWYILLNKVFFHVYEMKTREYTSTNGIKSFYYTLNEGLIGFKTKNNEIWRID